MESPQDEHDSTVVGPSDHYGSHHRYAPIGPSNSNNIGSTSNAAAAYSNHSNHYESNNRSIKLQQASHNNNNNNNNNTNSAINSNNAPANHQDETKVCVIVDSRTPVIFKIPVPPDRITLSDLKIALPAIDQPNYTYFFKKYDSEFGTVKEEIQDDDSVLPTFRDRVVAWIVTPGKMGDELTARSRSESGTCNLTYTNTSYNDACSSLFTTDVDTTSYFTETDDESISCSNYSDTTCETFIPQRRNQRHHSNKSPLHHHNNNHDNHNPSSSHRYSSLHDRNKNLTPSTSSTSSSASNSHATAVHCLTVHLVLTNENFLGLHIYANAVNNVDEGIYVDGVTAGSAVAMDGRIEPGDKLIQVNDTNLEELTNEQAVSVLKEAVLKRGPLKLVVAKFVETNKNDTIDGLIGKEAIHPIDTAAWVAHTQALTIPQNLEQANSATSSASSGSNAQDTDCIRPASAGIVRLGTGFKLNKNTSDIKEIIHCMKLPEIGITIKDREWLKLTIPKTVLGSDVVTWLERNVYGFNSNRDAKKFASRMLKEGYIRDPISKYSFSSKRCYTFVI